MHKLRCNIIGAGRLGKNLASSLIKAERISLGAILNRKLESAKEACLAINNGKAIPRLTKLPPADLLFITTPDDMIVKIVATLAEKNVVLPGSIVVHCSGVLNSEILKPLQEQGCFVASFHPLRAFRINLIDANSFKNCDCALEGDEQALNVLFSLFKPLGANLFTVNAEKKAIYHAAAVLAANHLVTLAAQASLLFTKAGITEENAKNITTRLMQTSLTNIQQTSNFSAALTGPLTRADISTIAKHLEAQEHLSTLSLYKRLSLQSLPLTALSKKQKDLLINMLKE